VSATGAGPRPPDGDRPGQDADVPRVVATAGHVDHGKSSLILRLTGMDPDRLAEEKRRGLTIDLGFAWTALPSGREIGFVDVPGHERFIRNMLAGVGPVRLVLFVVAADEGWKPQSEEHLQIMDVLGVDGGVVAVTKADLVDEDTLASRTDDIRRRMSGTRLAEAVVVACSSATGEGLDEIRRALDDMLDAAPPPDSDGRPRQYLDRVFTVRGSGTVVTGTLTGGPLAVGQEAEILPSGHRARIRGLQTHKRSLETARPVSRLAVNLVGTPREALERGDVLGVPGQWRPTRTMEGWIRPVRGLGHPLTPRGAYKLYAGSAERDARLRILGGAEVRPGETAFVRITLNRPAVLDVGDPFVLREAGRRETVAGGRVLDTDPPTRSVADPQERLRRRVDADRPELARQLVAERGAVRHSDVRILTGASIVDAAAGVRLGAWVVAESQVDSSGAALVEQLTRHHQDHPLGEGLPVAEARSVLTRTHPALADLDLADALMAYLGEAGTVVRTATTVRLPDHRPSTTGREDAERLVGAVREAEPTPPTVKELLAAGFERELIEAVCAEGRLVKVSAELLVTPGFLDRAEAVVRAEGRAPGLTVSGFRQALGTSRKYALPILEFFDARGLTRRQGDVRVVRD
jgi:selenocysteine-specific elongation factor